MSFTVYNILKSLLIDQETQQPEHKSKSEAAYESYLLLKNI